MIPIFNSSQKKPVLNFQISKSINHHKNERFTIIAKRSDDILIGKFVLEQSVNLNTSFDANYRQNSITSRSLFVSEFSIFDQRIDLNYLGSELRKKLSPAKIDFILCGLNMEKLEFGNLLRKAGFRTIYQPSLKNSINKIKLDVEPLIYAKNYEEFKQAYINKFGYKPLLNPAEKIRIQKLMFNCSTNLTSPTLVSREAENNLDLISDYLLDSLSEYSVAKNLSFEQTQIAYEYFFTYYLSKTITLIYLDDKCFADKQSLINHLNTLFEHFQESYDPTVKNPIAEKQIKELYTIVNHPINLKKFLLTLKHLCNTDETKQKLVNLFKLPLENLDEFKDNLSVLKKSLEDANLQIPTFLVEYKVTLPSIQRLITHEEKQVESQTVRLSR